MIHSAIARWPLFRKLFTFVSGYPKRRWSFFKGLPAPGNILELGCGNGGNLNCARLVHPSATLFGVDIVQAADLFPDINFAHADIDREKLPFADDSFDAVVLVHVIEHLRNPFLVRDEIARVLKPGGRFYVETPNWTSTLVPSFGIKREIGFPANFFDDPTHIRPWTKQSLFGCFHKGRGLRVEQVGTTREWPRALFDPFLMVAGYLLRDRVAFLLSFTNLFGWNIYVSGRKENQGQRP
ncbi:MAG: methyltransferase domain-containing protein [Thermodesulfobacteriota bacterium]